MKKFVVHYDEKTLRVEHNGNSLIARSFDELPRLIRFLSENAKPEIKGKTRKDLILNALHGGDYKSIQELLTATNCSQDEQRNFASTALNLCEKGKLKRKKMDGVFHYSLK